MAGRKMLTTTVLALAGILFMFVSMLQSTPLNVRYLCVGLMMVCEVAFAFFFFSLGTEG